MREMPEKLREMQTLTAGASPVALLVRLLTHPWGERTWLRVYTVAIAMAAFLSLIGAVDTGLLAIGERLTYWLVVMTGGTVAVQVVSAIVERFVKFEPLPEAIALFVISTPFILIVVWLLSAVMAGHAPDAASLRFYLLPVVSVSAAMSVMQYLLQRHPLQTHVAATPSAGAAIPGSAFRARLPFKYREAEIHALSAEDHYLRVYTSNGEVLVLTRLYDAIRELDGIEGSQTHRSWWVARDAVADIVRGDGRVDLKLKGGIAAPVSRTYQKALREGGWL